MANPTFERLLRRTRIKKGLSQIDVAERSTISRSLVSRLESGDRAPTRDNIAALCIGLGLTTWECERMYRSAGFVYNVNTAPLMAFAREALTNYEFDESIVNHLDQMWQHIIILAIGAQEATRHGWNLSSYLST